MLVVAGNGWQDSKPSWATLSAVALSTKQHVLGWCLGRSGCDKLENSRPGGWKQALEMDAIEQVVVGRMGMNGGGPSANVSVTVSSGQPRMGEPVCPNKTSGALAMAAKELLLPVHTL